MAIDANIYQALDTQAPMRLAAVLDPAAQEQRRFQSAQRQEEMAKLERAGKLREILGQAQGADPAAIAQTLGKQGFGDEAVKYQTLADAAQQRKDQKLQRDISLLAGAHARIGAKGGTPEAIAEEYSAIGLTPEQIKSKVDWVNQSLPPEKRQEYFLGVSDPAYFTKRMEFQAQREAKAEESKKDRDLKETLANIQGRQRMDELRARASNANATTAQRLAAQKELAEIKVSLNSQGNKSLSPTAQKEAFKTDEAVVAGDIVIDSLNRALQVNDKAWDGATAKAKRAVAGFIPANIEAENATVELENLVTGQALSQLKAIFGAAPTEGERKILLDIQGSVNMKAPQRKAIYERAIEFAQRRQLFNMRKADALRSGEYFNERFADESRPPNRITPPAVSSPAPATPAKSGGPSVRNW